MGRTSTPGRCPHLQGTEVFGPIGDIVWGAIRALLHLGCGRAPLWWLLGRGLRCVGRFCVTSGLWLRRREGGGDGAIPTGVSGCWWRVLYGCIGWGLSGQMRCWPLHTLLTRAYAWWVHTLFHWCAHNVPKYDCHPVVGLQ